MAYDEALASRCRAAVAGRDGLNEIKMFGGLCFTVNGNMYAGVIRDELMVRVGPEKFEAALARPGARPMEMTGRPMKGMVSVDGQAVASDEALAGWLQEALAFSGGLPAKAPGGRRKRR